jgi:hypothetical protein
MFKLRYYCVFTILLLNILTVGCNKLPPKPEGLPELHPCKITVTFGGEVVEGVNVSLVSVDSSYKWKASGRTDKNGVAEIRTSFAFAGAPVGQFKVGFDKIREAPGKSEGTIEHISYIPLKYGRKKTTEIIKIKEGGNEFTFTYDRGEERVGDK